MLYQNYNTVKRHVKHEIEIANSFLCRSRGPADNEEHKAEPGRSSDYDSSRGSYTLSAASRSSHSSSYSSSSSSNHTCPEKDDTFKWKGIFFLPFSYIVQSIRYCIDS